MKKLLIIFLLFLSFVVYFLFIKKDIPFIYPNDSGFHVRVSEYGRSWGGEMWYNIEFTRTNWITSETINQAFVSIGKVQHYQELFPTCENGVVFGKRFNTYKQCVAYNDSVKQVAKQLIHIAKSEKEAMDARDAKKELDEKKRKESECKGQLIK